MIIGGRQVGVRFLFMSFVTNLWLVGCGVTRDELQHGIADVEHSIEERDLRLAERFRKEELALDELKLAVEAQVDELRNRQSHLMDAVGQLNENGRMLSSKTAGIEKKIQETYKNLSSGTANLKKLVHERFLVLENRVQSLEKQLDTRLKEMDQYEQTFRRSLDLAKEERNILLEDLLRFVDHYSSMLEQSSMHISTARGALEERLDRVTEDQVAPEETTAASITEAVPARAEEGSSGETH